MNVKEITFLFMLLCFTAQKSFSQSIKQIDSAIKNNSLNIYGGFPPFITKDSIPSKFSMVDVSKLLGKHSYAIKNEKESKDVCVLNEKIPCFLFRMKNFSDGNLYGNFCLLDFDKKDSIFENEFSNLILTTELPGIVFKSDLFQYTILIRVSKNGNAWPRKQRVDTSATSIIPTQMDVKSIINNDISEVLLFDSVYNLKSVLVFEDKTTTVFSFDKNIKKSIVKTLNRSSFQNLNMKEIIEQYRHCNETGTLTNFSSISSKSIVFWGK